MLARLALVLTLLGATLASAGAQERSQLRRVGFVAPQGRSLPLLDAFRRGMEELGYVEGQDVVIEPRFAEGHYDRLPEIFADLIGRKVEVLAVTGAVTARAAVKATADIPIVFTMVVDPVADNVVSSVERPGGNVTGVTSFDPHLATRQLALFREVLPGFTRVGILGDKGVSTALVRSCEEQAGALTLQTHVVRVAGPDPDFEAAFAEFRQAHVDGVLVLEEPVLGVHAGKIAELAEKDRLPTMFAPSRAGTGGLLFYGTSQVAGIGRMAAYVDRILKGAAPGDLPVETINRYELIVNLAAARRIGVAIPDVVVKRATRVLE